MEYMRSPKKGFYFSLNPNKTLSGHCVGIINDFRFTGLSIEASGMFYMMICWSFYWASGINHYQDHANKDPLTVPEWSHWLRISKKKSAKIFLELQEATLIKIDDSGNVLINDFHFKNGRL